MNTELKKSKENQVDQVEISKFLELFFMLPETEKACLYWMMKGAKLVRDAEEKRTSCAS